MFCSSLRSRYEWSEVAEKLSSAANANWKECPLNGFDIAIPNRRKAEHLNAALFTDVQVKTSEAKKKLRRLIQMKGDKQLVIILLFVKKDSMVTFLGLQKEVLHERGISIIMATSIQDVIQHLSDIHATFTTEAQQKVELLSDKVFSRNMAAACSSGKRLSESQSDIVLENSLGLDHLAAKILDVNGQDTILDKLGNDAGSKVVSFFKSAPKPVYH